MILKMRPFLSISLFLLILLTNLQAQFNSVTEKISSFNQKFPQEILYVQVDREVYNPGDTLWFKCYLRNQVTLNESTASATLSVKIVNGEGEIVHDSKHPVFDSKILGQIPLDQALPGGNYELISYSSWMKNGSYAELFRKTIRIDEEKTGKESFNIRLSRELYHQGDTIRGTLTFLDKYGKELPGEKIEYRTGSRYNLSQKRSVKSSASPNLKIPVSAHISEDPRMEIFTTYKGFSFDTIINLPVPKNMDMGFYPEGGLLLEGLSNRVAFKMHSENGISFEIKGELFDDSGQLITEIQSDYKGMGSFPLIPEPGKRYYVKVSDPLHVDSVFYLPETEKEGWMLQASVDDEKMTLILGSTFDEERPALITVAIRGFMVNYVARSVNRFDSFSIPTKDMPPGIAVVTLFDAKGKPRAERLVFVNHNRLGKAQLESDRSAYLPRDSVALRISVSDDQGRPVQGSFSLSVVDEQLGKTRSLDEPGIISTLYLTGEIKGAIEDPESYFDPDLAHGPHYLDLLLLTQGWRKYRYEHMLENDIDALPPPRIYDVVNGQLLRYTYGSKGKPTPGSITVFNAGGTAQFETAEDGSFRYMHKYDPGLNPNVMFLGEGARPKDKVEIWIQPDAFEDLFQAFFENMSDSLFTRTYQHPDTDMGFEDQYTLGINNRWIEEVIVYGSSRKVIEFQEETFINSSSARKDVIRSAPDIYGVLMNMGLPVVKEGLNIFYTGGQYRGALNWYVDDFPREYDFVRNLWTGDIKAIFVVKFPDTQLFEIPDRLDPFSDTQDAYSQMIISIHMLPYNERPVKEKRSSSVMLPKITMAKEFYRPSYATEAQRYSQVPDLRKTLHWEPEVLLDENGEATVTFYNGDRYTRVSCILEGITSDGVPVHGETGYNIYTVRE